MFISDNARLLVNENQIEPNIAPYLYRLKTERKEVHLHSLNVAYLVAEILLRDFKGELGELTEADKVPLNEVVQGALLHDIGKLKIDNAILLKDKELSSKEYEEIKKHPLLGYEMIKDNPQLSDITKQIVLSHHERADGKGYPYGITNIDNSIKIVNYCDRYDAMTEDRKYRAKKSVYTALRILKDEIIETQNESDFDFLMLLASVNFL